MKYDPHEVREAHNAAAEEDRAEKSPSLRTEIPRAFIQTYLKPDDLVLDAGGGTGINAVYGFMRLRLSQGLLDEAIAIEESGETCCGMGPRTRLYTADEMKAVLQAAGFEILEVASTPTLTDAIDRTMYSDKLAWQKLKALEMEICTRPELLGMGHHLLFIARKK